MTPEHTELTAFERFLTLFTKLRPREGRGVLILFCHGFLILFAYYLIRPVRESLILTCSTPEVRSYSAGVQAALLLILIPLYGLAFRHHGKSLLIQRVNIFFIANLIGFYLLGRTDLCLGIPFFIWVGIFNVMVVAQFWAFAADLYNVKSGQRLFPVLAVGTALGAWMGARVSGSLMGPIGPFNLMLLSAAAIASTLVLSRLAEKAIPDDSRALPDKEEKSDRAKVLGGFGVVFRDRYLVLIALFIILLNWITSNGEFILAEYVTRYADELIAGGATALDQGTVIGEFYSGFYAWATMLTFVVQAFVVSRLFQLVGVRGAIPILPVLFLFGYGMIGFIPIFSLIQVILITHRGLENSLMLTTRNALFLPTSRTEKYEGKTTIETFFWRFGDLFQAAGIFFLIRLGGFGVEQIVALTTLLAVVMLATALLIGRRYEKLASSDSFNVPPEVAESIPDMHVSSGEAFDRVLAPGTFRDRDPGDVLTLRAARADGRSLPRWLSFQATRHRFHGVGPVEVFEEIIVRVTATDVDGTSVSDTFAVRHTESRSG